MKKLSIAEKSKRYDELKFKASRIYNKENDVLIMHTLEDLFPELKESEDEKIRKDIVTYLKSAIANKGYRDKFIESWIAWLEKQGEKGTKGNDREIPFDTWSEEDERMCTKTIFALAGFMGNEDKIDWLKSLKDRVQPKQEWSEEDDFMATAVENSFHLHCGQMTDRLSEQYKKFFEKVKSLRPQPQWKPSDGR